MQPPFILLAKEIEGVQVFTIYTDLPEKEAKQLKQRFEQAHDCIHEQRPHPPRRFVLQPMSACPVKG